MAHAALRPPDDAQPTGLTTPLQAYDRPAQAPLQPAGHNGSAAADAPAVRAPLAPAVPAPVTPLKRPAAPAKTGRRASRPSTAEAFCDLCGAGLDDHSGHYHMVSPLTARKVSVCRTCRRAALSEGYRPRA